MNSSDTEEEWDMIHKMLNDPAKVKRPKQIWKTAITPEALKEVEKLERERKARKRDQ